MQSPSETNSAPPDAESPEARSYAAARTAGGLLLLTAIATVVSVFTRVASGADQPTLLESLAAIAANKELYSIGGITRLASGITLIAAAGLRVEDMVRRRATVRAYGPGTFDCVGRIYRRVRVVRYWTGFFGGGSERRFSDRRGRPKPG